MDDIEIKKAAEAIVDDAKVDFKSLFDCDDIEENQVNFWMPVEYKGEYVRLQKATGKKFGRLCKQVLMACIDRAKTERDAS